MGVNVHVLFFIRASYSISMSFLQCEIPRADLKFLGTNEESVFWSARVVTDHATIPSVRCFGLCIPHIDRVRGLSGLHGRSESGVESPSVERGDGGVFEECAGLYEIAGSALCCWAAEEAGVLDGPLEGA